MSSPSEGDDGLAPDATVLHETRYDPDSNQGPVAPILEAVAVLEDRSVDLFREDPIHESVDIEAIETLLFGSQEDEISSAPSPVVVFKYREYLIHIHGDGRILVSEGDETTE